MEPQWWHMLLLALGALGLGLALVLKALPWGWRPSLVRRVEPQLRHHVPASGLLQGEDSAVGTWGSISRILGPVLHDGVQLLGGHGFVKEHPVERWYRDLRAIGVMEGAVLV